MDKEPVHNAALYILIFRRGPIHFMLGQVTAMACWNNKGDSFYGDH